MTNVSGNIFSQTITGQTIGSTISYAVKFAYAGGLSVTNYYTYVVGNNCALNVISNNELENLTFINPVENYLNINSQSTIDKVEIFDLLGKLVLSTSINTNNVDVRNLNKGFYLMTVYSGDKKSVKKIIVK
jgi:hypothetical protein